MGRVAVARVEAPRAALYVRVSTPSQAESKGKANPPSPEPKKRPEDMDHVTTRLELAKHILNKQLNPNAVPGAVTSPPDDTRYA